jgi:hypothetical protein
LLKFNWVLDVFMHLYWCLNVIVIWSCRGACWEFMICS